MHRRGHQPWCQPHQLVRMQLQHPALLRGFLPHRCRRRADGRPGRLATGLSSNYGILLRIRSCFVGIFWWGPFSDPKGV